MPFECKKCGASFYSETEFHEHEMYELMKDLLEKTTSSGEGFSIIAHQLQIFTIMSLAKEKNLTFLDACELHNQYWEILRGYKTRLRELLEKESAEKLGGL